MATRYFNCPKCNGEGDVIFNRETAKFRFVCQSNKRICRYEGPEITAPQNGKLKEAREDAFRAARFDADPMPPKYKKPIYA